MHFVGFVMARLIIIFYTWLPLDVKNHHTRTTKKLLRAEAKEMLRYSDSQPQITTKEIRSSFM
jgi:hypothetical protein